MTLYPALTPHGFHGNLPPPPLSPAVIQAQLDAYAARGVRIVQPQTLAIFAPLDENEQCIQSAQMAARHCFRMIVCGWSVVVADTYKVGLAVTAICGRFKIGCTIVGTSARPANGASLRHYERVVCPSRTVRDRIRSRDAYMLATADEVMIIGSEERLEHIAWVAGQRDKKVWRVSRRILA